MSSKDVIRARKDEGYRFSLTGGQPAALPANPAGNIELSAQSARDPPFTDAI